MVRLRCEVKMTEIIGTRSGRASLGTDGMVDSEKGQ